MDRERQGEKGRERPVEAWLRRQAQIVLVPIAAVLDRLGASPNLLTALGFLLTGVVAWTLARGMLQLGGLLLLLVAPFDALDGALARLTGRQSRFGAFLDSTVDRFSEAVVFFGLLVHYIGQGARGEVLLIYAAIVGSLMVSYARARAEGLGLPCKVGLLTRIERVFVMGVGLLLGHPRLALWVVAVLANFTALQRMAHVWRVSRAPDGAGASAPEPPGPGLR